MDYRGLTSENPRSAGSTCDPLWLFPVMVTYVRLDHMALDIIVLSILRRGPLHGYELKRRVQRPTLTPLSNNSLYPMLSRFEAAGVVTMTVQEQEGKPARKVYAITDLGRQHLMELLSELPPALARNEEEFLVRLSFFAELTPAARGAILDARRAVLNEELAQVQELLREEERSPSRVWRTFAQERLLDRLDSERTWIAALSTESPTLRADV